MLDLSVQSNYIFCCALHSKFSPTTCRAEYSCFVITQIISDLISQLSHEKTCFMRYANNKDADQLAHLRSLISVFVVYCLDILL